MSFTRVRLKFLPVLMHKYALFQLSLMSGQFEIPYSIYCTLSCFFIRSCPCLLCIWLSAFRFQVEPSIGTTHSILASTVSDVKILSSVIFHENIVNMNQKHNYDSKAHWKYIVKTNKYYWIEGLVLYTMGVTWYRYRNLLSVLILN